MNDDVPYDDPIRAAVRAGARDVASDPAFWQAALGNLRTQAAEMARNEAGNWLIGRLKWAIGRAVVGAAIILILWKTGGMAAVIAYLNGPTK